MTRPSTSFHLGDAITGEPHLHCSQSFTDRHSLSRLEQEPREFRLRTTAAIHLPRIILMACGAAAIALLFVGLATAEATNVASPVGQMTAECAERDLKVQALIEQHGDASDLPASVLAEVGLSQLDARLTCLSDRHVEALAKYDRILTAPHLAQHAAK